MHRFVIFARLVTPLLAQTAELSGLISDRSGLPVPSAAVNVQRRENGATRRAVSNQQGLYRVPALPPGTYDVAIEATGFKSFHQNGISLEVDQRATLDPGAT